MKSIKSIYMTDLRSLGVARILFAILFITDMLNRLSDFNAHYSKDGIFPIYFAERFSFLALRNFAIENDPQNISLYFLTDSNIWQLFLMLLTLVGGVSLLVGYKTRLSSLICWVLVLSLQNRVSILYYPGDYVLRMGLLMGVFIPWAKCFSIDGMKKPVESNSYSDIGTFILTLFIIYFLGSAGVSKLRGPWLSGEAIFYLVNSIRFQTFFSSFLADKMFLIKFFTWTTLFFEIVGPLMLLLPQRFTLIKALAVFGLVSMFVSIRIFCDVGYVTLLAGALTVGLMPSIFWDLIGKTNLGKLVKF